MVAGKANFRGFSGPKLRKFNAACGHFGLALRERLKITHTTLCQLEREPTIPSLPRLVWAIFRQLWCSLFKLYGALGVEEQRVLIISDITSDPEQWQTLGDGYRVESRFILWEEPNVLQIPASALFRSGDQWAIFVVQNNKARRHLVKVGQRNGLSAQILEGLTEGEAVITHPNNTIDDGVRVRPR